MIQHLCAQEDSCQCSETRLKWARPKQGDQGGNDGSRRTRDDGGSDLSGRSGSGERWSDSGDILNVEPRGFGPGECVGLWERKESKMTGAEREGYNQSPF